MPVPFFANTEEDREVLLSQRGVSEVFNLARSADLKIVGIGTVDNQAHLMKSGMLKPGEIEEIAALGGVGELLGNFFDRKGRILQTSVTARTLAASFSETGEDRITAIAGGPIKTEAIRAVLHSCKLHGLITDERTARELLSV
jgi:DNA-binding transcriptional regulator LsrR (DeoR family)